MSLLYQRRLRLYLGVLSGRYSSGIPDHRWCSLALPLHRDFRMISNKLLRPCVVEAGPATIGYNFKFVGLGFWQMYFCLSCRIWWLLRVQIFSGVFNNTLIINNTVDWVIGEDFPQKFIQYHIMWKSWFFKLRPCNIQCLTQTFINVKAVRRQNCWRARWNSSSAILFWVRIPLRTTLLFIL